MNEKKYFKILKDRIIVYFSIITIILIILLIFMTYVLTEIVYKREKTANYESQLLTYKNDLLFILEEYRNNSSYIAIRLTGNLSDKDNIEKIISNRPEFIKEDLLGIFVTSEGEIKWHYKRFNNNYRLPNILPDKYSLEINKFNSLYFTTISIPVYINQQTIETVNLYYKANKLQDILSQKRFEGQPYSACLCKIENKVISEPIIYNSSDLKNIYRVLNESFSNGNIKTFHGNFKYLYADLENLSYAVLMTFPTKYFNQSIKYFIYFSLLFSILFIILVITGLNKLMTPIEKIVNKQLVKLDSMIEEKTQKVEQIYSSFLLEKEKNVEYMNIVGVMIITLDTTFNVKMTNKKTLTLIGCEEKSIIGENWISNYIPIEEQDIIIELLKNLTSKSHDEIASYEGGLITSNGEKRIIHWTIVYSLKDEKSRSEYIMSGEDITDKKNLEEEYRQAQKMESIGRLAGGIAHDFNNLLTIIIGNSEILLSELNKKNQSYKDVESISKAAYRAASLTDQLLAFSRKQVLKPETLEVNKSIRSLIKMISRLLGENITIETSLDENVRNIKADKGQFEQILLNLSVNSKDAMPNGGVIRISTKNIHIDKYYCSYYREARPGHFICITFSDTGLGIPEKVIKNIFEPFFTTKEIGKGTGLGLSVVYGIVKQHEGWINVQTTTGQGTTFVIYLPILLEESNPNLDGKEKIDIYKGNGETILFVEDEEEIRIIISGILIKKGYNVITSESLKDGINDWRNNKDKIDLIISDVVLTDGTGIELIEQIEQKQPNLHVIFSSGYVTDAKKLQGMTSKGYKFIQKPYSIIDLLKMIKGYLP